jgi:hypothetical protein
MRAETGRKMGSGGGAMAAGLREREWRPFVLAGFIVLATAAAMLAIGRPAICPCGYVLLWDGRVGGGDNSQHLTDWYTFSHVIHGFLFYGLLRLVAPGWSFGWRLVGALVLEVGWEFVENTPWLIERYRGQTVALDYMGDSVINSVSDVGFMVLGFWLAARLPVAVTLALAVAMEVTTAMVIRDGLLLNVLMLVWPVEAVLEWQQGA